MAYKVLKIFIAMKMVRDIEIGEQWPVKKFKDRRTTHTDILFDIISSGAAVANMEASLLRKDGLHDKSIGDLHILLEAKT